MERLRACPARSRRFVAGNESREQGARLLGEIPGLRHYLLQDIENKKTECNVLAWMES